MLTVVRRGSASITKLLLIPSTSSPCVKSFISRSYRQHATQTPSPHLIRFLSTAPQWKQRNALANEDLEDEIVESQIEQKIQSQTPPSDSQTDEAAHHGPVTKFQGLLDRKLVCETVVKTITDVMRLETMTQVQSMTINETLKGIDVIAQARTGTGKTLAFLIPVLQNIISRDPSLEHHKGWGNSKKTTPMDIRAIIISPTRELAEQIAVEANKLVRNTGVIVQTAVGGSAKQFGLRKIEKEGCHVLVGTPGRLNDILSDPYSRVRAPNLSALVLDEADRLLDQGFSLEIAAIQKNLPQRSEVDRQTLLFSATVPQEVMQMVRSTMKRDFKFVRTVQEGELQTHQKVPQKVVNIRSFENLMPALLELCKRKIAEADELPFKAIVYFGATAEVTLAASIFRNLKNPGASAFHQHPLSPAKIIEIHAKLTQAQRTHAADDFRRSKSGILFSSDVTARGMDFPNVTHVIQIGIPANRDTYIHRLGRTARGDKPGEGWLFATPVDGNVVRERLNNLPLEVDRSLDTGTVDMTKDAQLPEDVATTLTQVVDATKMVPFSEKRAAYVACLGVYQWVQNKQNLINLLNSRSTYGWGAHTPPADALKTLLAREVEGIDLVLLGAITAAPPEVDLTDPRGVDMADLQEVVTVGFRGVITATLQEADHQEAASEILRGVITVTLQEADLREVATGNLHEALTVVLREVATVMLARARNEVLDLTAAVTVLVDPAGTNGANLAREVLMVRVIEEVAEEGVAMEEIKAEAAALKTAAESSQKAATEEEQWSKGAKSNAKKEEATQKRLEASRKKAEKDALLAAEESTARALPKNTKSAPKKSSAKPLDLSQLDSPDPAPTALNATGIDNALDALSLTTGASASEKIDRHPERRFKAAYAAFEARRLPELETEMKGLRRQQRIDVCRKEFERSEENPFNQVRADYDASKEEVRGLREQERGKVEERLGGR
ncbi:hypothetical protein MMC12_001635 [Toensbergia leucococca]|nr:hypothetical protein [Toensbergia leucococca]